ncbi:hypothetical protein GCM10010439_41470 [Actinocorallia aurantiaca]|uniref:Uncharacterized protein n=1 Tax=Actinocorallia aurantiaca TaxID=46204 RepID=A0ABP6GSW8_9ACTN
MIEEKILADLDILGNAVDEEELVSLIAELSGSRFEEAQGWAVRIISDAIEYITMDISGWEDLEWASALIDQLSEIDDPIIHEGAIEAQSNLDERMQSEAEEILEAWLDLDYLRSKNQVEMIRQIVYYTSMLSNADELIPSYEAAVRKLARLEEVEDYQSNLEQVQVIDESTSIHGILGSLREEQR